MSAPCIDAPCCGCCSLQADTEPREGLEPDQEELDDEVVEDGELARDRILDDQERSDFAQDDLPSRTTSWDPGIGTLTDGGIHGLRRPGGAAAARFATADVRAPGHNRRRVSNRLIGAVGERRRTR